MKRTILDMAMLESTFVTRLRCLRCGREYKNEPGRYVCSCRSNQGSDMGTLSVEYDYAAIQQHLSPESLLADPGRSIGRWWPLLPVGRTYLPPLPVGDTPLLAPPRLREHLGLKRLYVKDDGRNPSASFKDRASAIAVAQAQADGWSTVATASTGNAAAALASQAAAAGQPNVIFVPRSAPPAKIAQLMIHGSTVLAVDGSYDQAFDLCREACEAFGWYNRNTGFNPMMTEGKKTVSFEIAAELGHQSHAPGFQVPDALFVSVGDGCIIGGVHKGFSDLLRLGWTERMPRIYGVQSSRSDAIFQAWRSGADVPGPVQSTTRADSISVNAPRDAVKALAAVRRSSGAMISIDDDAILAAIEPLARLGAVFAEPAGAAALAGLLQARNDGLVLENETVVLINTGSGLKDVAAVTEAVGGPTVIPPTLDAVRALGLNDT